MQTRADIEIRGAFRDLRPSTRGYYRRGWRVWSDYCATVSVDPCRASVPEAQAWIDSMKHQHVSAGYIARHVQGVRMCLEYLAMVGHRPYEPFHHVVVPQFERRGPVRPAYEHEILTDERVGRALYDSRVTARAHGILWACAGMGLASADLAAMRDPARIRQAGDCALAVVPRGGRAHLVPVPRELMLVVAEIGWPITVKQSGVRNTVAHHLQPFISTSAKELRDFHRDCAIRLGMDEARVLAGMNDMGPTSYLSTDRTRFNWSTHASIVVCAHLRKLVLDISTR